MALSNDAGLKRLTKATILALNAGSSSVKFGLYEFAKSDFPELVSNGEMELGAAPRLIVRHRDGEPQTKQLSPGSSVKGHLEALLATVQDCLGERSLSAVGHRIVHGGRNLVSPIRLTPSAIEAIDDLTPLAPLHQPRSLLAVRALQAIRPDLPQVGCFDTAFHRTMAPTIRRLALPREYELRGIERYGFHGLSYEHIARRLGEISPDLPAKRTIVAHLGNGASLCAMLHGRSVDTTMGFSALDGLVMGTRCGTLDPGVLLYLLLNDGMSAERLQDMLYHDAGLLGVSGISSDMRELEASRDPRAQEALDLFAFRAAKEAAALVGTLEGLECVVFTGGIGEHSAQMRAMICERLGWLGIAIDGQANRQHEAVISKEDSEVQVRVIPADEQIVLARHTAALLNDLLD